MRKSTGNYVYKLADFELGEEIGRGGFGVVHKATCNAGELKGQVVAIKKVNANQRSELLRQEVENHQSLDHENIVKFYGCFKEKNENYIVMELCDKGSLKKYIKDNCALTHDQALSVLRQVVEAIQYLHRKGVCHRDLTSGNVLINRIRRDGDIYVKICDFGLAKVMNGGRAAHTVAGTPGYMDPHVTNRKNYGKEVDLYSLGCLLYTMLTGTEPLSQIDEKFKFPRLVDLEHNAVQLIKGLTDPDRSNRIKLENVKHTPFMSGSSSMRQTDHPTSIRSRRSEHKSRERRTSMEQLSTRERSKSRPPLREMNHSPPAPPRQLGRSRSSSQVRVPPTERTSRRWPINIDRLQGKHEEESREGREEVYRLEVTKTQAVLKKNGRRAMIVNVGVDRRSQEVGIPDHSRTNWEWYRSMDSLPQSQLRHYDTVLRLVEGIRWKVAKVIFNNSSICKKGVIRLMENGDFRMKDAQGNIYSVKANSDEVLEGHAKNPTGTVRDRKKIGEILRYRELCRKTEEAMESLGFDFPYISYDLEDDTKTVKRNVREAIGESRESSRAQVSSGLRERNATSREVSMQRESRAKSTCSHAKKPTAEGPLTNRSAPPGSMRHSEKENGLRQITISRTRSGEICGVKDKSDGSSLRKSHTTPSEFIYIDSTGREERFTFTGNYASLSPNQASLMKRLISRQ